MSYEHDLECNSWDALSCISWYPFFQLIQFCEVFLGLLQTGDLLSTQDRLAIFSVHLLSPIHAEHSQHGHGRAVGRTGGGAWGHGCRTLPGPPAHETYLTLASVPSLHFGATDPLGLLPAMAAFRELFVIFFAFFLDILGFLFTFSLLCVWVLLFLFSRPDFFLFHFFSWFTLW